MRKDKKLIKILFIITFIILSSTVYSFSSNKEAYIQNYRIVLDNYTVNNNKIYICVSYYQIFYSLILIYGDNRFLISEDLKKEINKIISKDEMNLFIKQYNLNEFLSKIELYLIKTKESSPEDFMPNLDFSMFNLISSNYIVDNDIIEQFLNKYREKVNKIALIFLEEFYKLINKNELEELINKNYYLLKLNYDLYLYLIPQIEFELNEKETIPITISCYFKINENSLSKLNILKYINNIDSIKDKIFGNYIFISLLGSKEFEENENNKCYTFKYYTLFSIIHEFFHFYQYQNNEDEFSKEDFINKIYEVYIENEYFHFIIDYKWYQSYYSNLPHKQNMYHTMKNPQSQTYYNYDLFLTFSKGFVEFSAILYNYWYFIKFKNIEINDLFNNDEILDLLNTLYSNFIYESLLKLNNIIDISDYNLWKALFIDYIQNNVGNIIKLLS